MREMTIVSHEDTAGRSSPVVCDVCEMFLRNQKKLKKVEQKKKKKTSCLAQWYLGYD